MKRKEVISWLKNATSKLTSSKDWAKDWVELRILFYRECHAPNVFSTRITEFEEILYHVESEVPLLPPQGSPLGEYDKNFNDWIKQL